MKKIISTFWIIYDEVKNYFLDLSKNIIPLISGFLIVLLIRSVLTIMDTLFIQEEFPVQRIIFILSTALLIMGLEIGYTKFVFSIIDNKKNQMGLIFNYFHLLSNYCLAMIIYYIIILIVIAPLGIFIWLKYGADFFNVIKNALIDPYFQGLASSYLDLNQLMLIIIVCLLPGMYVAMRFSFWSYFVIDQESNSIESIKKSWVLTENKIIEIFILGCVLLFFNLIGTLTIVGVCFTIPISYLFFCLYFRYLINTK